MRPDNKIKSKLLQLPLSDQDKIYLWLVITGDKPAAAITVKSCWYCDREMTVKPKKGDSQKLIKFFKDCHLIYAVKENAVPGIYGRKVRGRTSQVPVIIFGQIFFVSLKEKRVSKLKKCFSDSGRLSQRNNLMAGKILGYPAEAVEEFAKTIDFSNRKTPSSLSTLKDTHRILRGKYWETYVGYVVRKGFEVEDSQTARRWADVIRRDLPELAKKYEKGMSRIIEIINKKTTKDV